MSNVEFNKKRNYNQITNTHQCDQECIMFESSSKHSRKPQRRGPPFKYRPPEPHEQNKRIINNHPHTYNPSTRRWDKDNAP